MSGFVGVLRGQIRMRMPDLTGYSAKTLVSDIFAGLTVGIIALPLSLALAIATGVPPIMGLYTAGIAGFMAALFAGSPYSVSGPAAAMVPILASIIKTHGLSQLPYITILAAIFLFTFALLGIGKYIRKVPESVVLGFTAGVAAVLFFGQLNNFMGLKGIVSHEHFAQNLFETITHLATISLPTIVIGFLALAIIMFSHRVPGLKKVPPTLVAVLVTTLLVSGLSFFHGHVTTLGSKYGALPMGINFTGTSIMPGNLLHSDLWLPALEIAALISIESLLCAVVADKLTKTQHRSNQELAAQSVANLSSAMFGGLPATAVIARTGTIIKEKASSRLASILHAVVVLAFVIALAPLASAIPLATLSAVLLVTAVKISEFKEVKRFVTEKSMRISSVLVVTLLLTIFTDLVIGVSGGMLLHLGFKAHNKLGRARDQDGPLVLVEEEIS